MNQNQEENIIRMILNECIFESYRSSRRQRVNMSDDSIKITHVPTGISVVSQEKRTLFENKKEAVRMLLEKLRKEA